MVTSIDVQALTVGYAIEALTKPGKDDHPYGLELEWPETAATATDVRVLIVDQRRMVFATATGV